jgi:hypothetical protein
MGLACSLLGNQLTVYQDRDALLMIHGRIRVQWARGKPDPLITGARPGEVSIVHNRKEHVAHIKIKTHANACCCCCGGGMSSQTTDFDYGPLH